MTDKNIEQDSTPWIEKYRPETLNDIVLDETIMNQIKIFLQGDSLNHLIITGLPGIGKTSAVKCLAREILKDNFLIGFLELNASDDRGIKTISGTLPPFCKKKVSFTQPKIILLDEADNITPKAQQEISKMMKEFTASTKFIFTCNDSTSIIEAIQSNCSIIRFKRLTDIQIKSYLEKICAKEGAEYNSKGLDAIIYSSMGDMRKAINNLQVIFCGFKKITETSVYKIVEYPNPESIKEIIELCMNSNLKIAIEKMGYLRTNGYSAFDIALSFSTVLQSYDMDEKKKMIFMDVINKASIEISRGLDSDLQINAVICRIIKRLKGLTT